MAIQMRRGAYANLDKSKLVAGEIVMSTDTNYVGIAKAPSQVLQLATTDMLELPVASTNILGGVKVGDNLSIDSSGRLSATGGGGTTVIANPTGTATDDLTKIQIGQTIYGVEGGSGEVIEMTYAQYQALTPQQKMDGTVRYVNDYPSGGGSLPDYSTIEHKTGQKWIDGKDIYERVLPFSLNGTIDSAWTKTGNYDYTHPDYPIGTISQVIMADIIRNQQGGHQTRICVGTGACEYNPTTGKFYLNFTLNYTSWIILQYTKA